MDKKEIIKKAIILLTNEIEKIESAIESEYKSYRDAPSAMQSWSDTTRSQKEDLIFELNKQIYKKRLLLDQLRSVDISPHEFIKLGSLIELEQDNEKLFYFIIPGIITETIKNENTNIIPISPNSIVANSLYNHKSGDLISIKVPAGISQIIVIKVY
ncbi:MAG: hypothetical protein JXB17_00990 [Bacteroidales bacterium]|nr:hypothetical protein [Bacteroidales bacterium]